MITVNLPGLVAGRDLADDIVDRLGPLSGVQVVVDARSLVNGTASFAGEFVERTLHKGNASELVVIGAPARFESYLQESADRLGVGGKLVLREDDEFPAAAH